MSVSPQDVLDAYWPIIDEARKLRAFYCGDGTIESGTMRIMPDEVAPLIQALDEAHSKFYIVQDPE
jgi:hypothetical protein